MEGRKGGHLVSALQILPQLILTTALGGGCFMTSILQLGKLKQTGLSDLPSHTVSQCLRLDLNLGVP